jgi:thiol-disulfide isomerase/thioredoxin
VAMEVPITKNNDLFQTIISKYKGKVVFVDFWATWCAPCRTGIERIKPLKEDYNNKNVVFVYITNQTSPKDTYNNLIPTIKGEHYRLTSEEWNILSNKFNISGIPHQVIVDKTGLVVNPNFQYVDNPQFKSVLDKLINK